MSDDPNPQFALNALSPLDGRYASRMGPLRDRLSEAAFMQRRVQVEVAWLIGLSELGLPELPALNGAMRATLEKIGVQFNAPDALAIKEHERVTNHDVKAVEYFIKDKLGDDPAWLPYKEFVHFACTSEDINNTSHALMLQATRSEILVPVLGTIAEKLQQFALQYAAVPMLSRTHGQTASPTTVGKEFANVLHRLNKALANLQAVALPAKMNGAVGNYNAHLAAYPAVDWPAFSAKVIQGLGLVHNTHTTQIEPHDGIAQYLDAVARINTILLDLDRDIWGYISLGYFTQKLKAGEVGSSTMPHKVNPIDFENSEGNLGVANALLRHLADKLPVSRWQRDLTDSTVLRNLGVALGYGLLAYDSLLKGLGKLEVNTQALAHDLDDAWEVLGEAIQTVMRRYGLPSPYEQLKALTRGQKITAPVLAAFLDTSGLPAAEITRLKQLTPGSYVGLAASLAQKV
jgi:adenylosuccinate lyase